MKEPQCGLARSVCRSVCWKCNYLGGAPRAGPNSVMFRNMTHLERGRVIAPKRLPGMPDCHARILMFLNWGGTGTVHCGG